MRRHRPGPVVMVLTGTFPYTVICNENFINVYVVTHTHTHTTHTHTHQYENLKRNMYIFNASIYFNQRCLHNNTLHNFIKILLKKENL